MKIVHLCLASFFPDNYSYQENMLPKFHKQLGFDVEVIASTQSFDEHGNTCYLEKTEAYYNENDIKVLRLQYKSRRKIWRKMRRYIGVYEALCCSNPDILFIHGCQFLDMDQVVKYLKKHSDIKVYVDNHADFSNSATNWLSKNVLHKIIWRRCAHIINPYTIKFYGVLPARVDFLRDIYHLPKEKCELLVMGADDDLIEKAKLSCARRIVRDKYSIKEDDFLVMTGGKIDKWKTQTILLMKAIHNIPNEKIRLIVFGSVAQELSERINALSDGVKVQFVGWIQAEETYNYVEAADLFVFPGRHSVFWEQVTGQGIPMIVKNWPGTQHVDLGGNVLFLDQDSVEEIQRKVEAVTENPAMYQKMLNIARVKGKTVFSYREIAKRAIQI